MPAGACHTPGMAIKRLPRPRDPIQLGKLIGDILTGQVVDAVDDGKDAAAVARGKLGGKKGGRARAAHLTEEQRSASAQKAAQSRWGRGGSYSSGNGSIIVVPHCGYSLSKRCMKTSQF